LLTKTIPISAFYADISKQWAHQPSPDGSLIANLGTQFGKTVVHIRHSANGRKLTTLKAKGIDICFWHPIKNFVWLLIKGRLWMVDPYKSARTYWTDVTPRGFQTWDIINVPSTMDEQLIIASNDRDPKLIDLYEVNQDGRGKQSLIQNTGYTLEWILDSDNKPFLTVNRKDDDGQEVHVKGNDGNWHLLIDVMPDDTLRILHEYHPGKPLHALSNRGRDKIALVEIDINSGGEKLIDAHDHVDVYKVFRICAFSTVIDLVVYAKEFQEFKALSSRGEKIVSFLESFGCKVDLDYIEATASGEYAVVCLSLSEAGYQTYFLNLETGEKHKLYEDKIAKHKENLGVTKPVSIKARDGLELQAYLTTQRGLKPENLPTIINVHGGPAEHVVWKYDHFKNFLASRGYAVLDVNFRGSTGFGKKFQQEGFKNVGRTMQTDILDSAAWLIEQGISETNNIGIMGASYGGYSAALAMTREGGTFVAGVVEMAVTDIEYQMRNNPFAWGLSLGLQKRYFGDVENSNDNSYMQMVSPINNIESAQGAILVLHGKKDPVIGFEQSEEFVSALSKAGKQVKAHYFEEGEHGYVRWQDELNRARTIERFLADHLGGRRGRLDWSVIMTLFPGYK